MPPKRGKKSQAAKASALVTPAKGKSRKKQAAIQVENEESNCIKTGTKVKSRTSMITPTLEAKDSIPKKALEKPKATKRGTRISHSGTDSLPQNSSNELGLNINENDQESTDIVNEGSQKVKKPKKGEKMNKLDSKPKAEKTKGTGRKGPQKARVLRGKASSKNDTDQDNSEEEDPDKIDADVESLSSLNKSAVHGNTEEKMETDTPDNLPGISTENLDNQFDGKEDLNDLSKLNVDNTSNNSKVLNEEEVAELDEKIIRGEDIHTEVLKVETNNGDFSNNCKSDEKEISQETEVSSFNRGTKQMQDTTHLERSPENDSSLEQYENNVEETQDDENDDKRNISADSSAASIASKDLECKDTAAESPEEFEGFEVTIKKKALSKLVLARDSASYYEHMEDSDGNFEDSSLDSSEYVYEEEQNYLNKNTKETVDDPEENFMGTALATTLPVIVAESYDVTASDECFSESGVEVTSQIQKTSRRGRKKMETQTNVRSKRLSAAKEGNQERRNSSQKRKPSFKNEIPECSENKTINPKEEEEKCRASKETSEKDGDVDPINEMSISDINEGREEKNKKEECVDFVHKKSEEEHVKGRRITNKASQLKDKFIVEKSEVKSSTESAKMEGALEVSSIVQKEENITRQGSSSNLLEVSEENKLGLGFSKSEENLLMDSEIYQEDNKEDDEIKRPGDVKENKERRVRKSRWDDPRKFEERCKEDVEQMSIDIETQSSSVPVETIQSKEEFITNTENVTTNERELEQDEGNIVSTVEKDGDEKFDAVILLADSLLESSLRKLKDPASHNIHMIMEKNLNYTTIVSVVHKHKQYYSKHALWVLVSGVFNMAETVTHPECKGCTPPVERLSTLDESYTSVEDIAVELQKLVGLVYPVCKQVQDELGSNGLFILSPPVPVSVILEEAANSHQALHGGCNTHSTYCVDSQTMISLHVSYNMFCDVWTKFACEQMKPWLPVQLFENFYIAQRGKHITPIRNPLRFQPYSLMAWVRTITAVAKMAMTKSFPMDIAPVMPKQDEIESALFNHVIVMGNLKYLDHLKELTADFPITFVDQGVDFDEDGIVIIKEEQKKWPQGTLCLILSGISGIAEPIECGPICARASCDDPLPIFIPKNQPGGDPDFTEMSNEDMVSVVVKQAFDFARDAVDYMKEGSALFLAPIMPVQAVLGDKNSKFSHETLHELVEEKSVPIFGAGSNEWMNCAREFERKWIELTMENLEQDSPVFKLYEKYCANKPFIIQFVDDPNENLEGSDLRETWSQLVFNIMKDFLKKEDSKVHPYQAVVHASEYQDIVQEAQSRYAIKTNQNQTSGETSNWKDWSYAGQQYSYDSTYYGNYGPNSWMMGNQAWPSASPPPGYPPGPPPPGVPPPGVPPPGPPPPGAPPPWVAAPPQSWGSWQSGAQPMWGSGPPPPPPPSAPSAQNAPPLSWQSAPPPVWTSVPPPVMDAPPQVVKQQQQSGSGFVSPATGTTSHRSGETSVKPGANLMIQNVVTDLKVDQAMRILQCFGDLTYLKWPLDHLNKPAKFLMACYKERENAERCVRVLNYVKPFGKDSEAKQVGATCSAVAVGYVRDDDIKSVTLIQDILKQIKDEKLLHLNDNSNRVVVSNISNLLTGKMINDIFFGLKANRSFKNLDLSVISTDEEHHFFVCGSVLTVKLMDGYRFPDKKLKVKLVGPDENKEFSTTDKEAARAEIDSVMKKHIDTLAELVANKHISKKDVNIYTFKTVRCQNEKACKSPGLCHDYHVWKDRRRCPILFKYSDEMCTRLDSNGKCPARDKCSKAHTHLEIPFHLKNFRAHLCQSFRKKGRCDKTDKICAYLHPGTTEAFFDQQWRDLLVEGLEKTITYFVGAIMNLFKVSKQNCVRVLLITPAPEMVPLLVKSMEPLVFSCDQEIQALPEDGRAQKATILVGTPKAVVNWMAEEKKRDSVNIDRLKALIIDDGPEVVDYIDVQGYNFLIEFAKIKDLNKVITTEKITWQSTKALERLRILTDYKKAYAKDDGRPRVSPSRERSSSPSRKRKNSPPSPSRIRSEKYSRGNTDKYEDDIYRHSKEREKQKYYSSAEDIADYERQNRKMQQEESLCDLVEERRYEQERYEIERKEKEAEERNYEAYLVAKEKLKHEHEKERKLYFDLPEAHPEYQEKYRVFLDQYRSHYPGRNDPEHCHKLWMLFWKELVSSMLETAYKKKREVLESEFFRSQSASSSNSSSMKRKAVGDEDLGTKYAHTDVFDQSRPGTSADSLIPTTSGHGHSATSQPFPTTLFSVPDAVTIISDVSNFLGELSPALRLVIHKIREVNMDVMETKKIFSNYDNAMIIRMASEKLKELSESFPSPNKEKLSLASYHASQLLQLSSEVPPVQTKAHHGLDIKKVAWATLNKDPAFIIQFITNALMYEGVTDPTQDEISDIFIMITNAHYSMKHQK